MKYPSRAKIPAVILVPDRGIPTTIAFLARDSISAFTFFLCGAADIRIARCVGRSKLPPMTFADQSARVES
jgi:hypothetical protein